LITGNDFISTAISESHDYQIVVNSSISELGIPGVIAEFGLDPLIQAVIWISVVGVVAVASSITVVASGISESGTRWLTGMIFFISLWLMFSMLPYPLFVLIETYGMMIYFVLTIFYAIGAIWYLLSGSD